MGVSFPHSVHAFAVFIASKFEHTHDHKVYQIQDVLPNSDHHRNRQSHRERDAVFLGCFSDCFEFCKASNAPAIAVGEIAEATGASACGSCTSFTLIGCMLSPSVANCIHGCTTAKKLREQHGLEASGYKLAMAHWCCGTCAKTQELRLVKMVREAKQQALEQRAPVRQTMAGSPAM